MAEPKTPAVVENPIGLMDFIAHFPELAEVETLRGAFVYTCQREGRLFDTPTNYRARLRALLSEQH